ARNLRGLPVPRAGAGTRTVHAVRATLLLAVGLVAVLDPDGVVTVVVIGAGAVALYLALIEAVAAFRWPRRGSATAASPPRSASQAPRGTARTRSASGRGRDAGAAGASAVGSAIVGGSGVAMPTGSVEWAERARLPWTSSADGRSAGARAVMTV